MTENKVGEFIKERRSELSLTQKELAEKIGVTDKAISRWETGKGLPDVSILILLSDVLGVTINEILKGETAAEESGENIDQEKFNEQVIETAKNLIPVIDRQVKIKKRNSILEVISGIVLTAIMWAAAILVSGCQMLTDYQYLFKANVSVVVFPFVIAILCIGVAVFSAKCDKEVFFKTTMICLLIPFAAFLLMLPVGLLNSGSTSVIELILMFPYWPLGSLMMGVSEYLSTLPAFKTAYVMQEIFSFIAVAPILLGVLGAFSVYNELEE